MVKAVGLLMEFHVCFEMAMVMSEAESCGSWILTPLRGTGTNLLLLPMLCTTWMLLDFNSFFGFGFAGFFEVGGLSLA